MRLIFKSQLSDTRCIADARGWIFWKRNQVWKRWQTRNGVTASVYRRARPGRRRGSIKRSDVMLSTSPKNILSYATLPCRQDQGANRFWTSPPSDADFYKVSMAFYTFYFECCVRWSGPANRTSIGTRIILKFDYIIFSLTPDLLSNITNSLCVSCCYHLGAVAYDHSTPFMHIWYWLGTAGIIERRMLDIKSMTWK